MSEHHGTAATSPEKSVGRVTLASTLGATIEWYDFFLYGVVTPIVFNKLFFPAFDPVVGIMLAYTTFAVGFLARPIGGIIFGHFGDRIGRKRMLIVTILLMGVATSAIGFLPTYDAIGVWAPILLLGLRILQGIGLGGEWGGAVLMAVEYAPMHRRGYFGSWPQVGAPAGLCLSAGVVALLSMLPDEQFLSWGWRVAFWLSAALVVLGIYIRLSVDETPAFAEVQSTNSTADLPFLEMIRTERRNVLLGLAARYIEGVGFNIYGVFVISYLTNVLKLQRSIALLSVIVAALFMIVFMPIFGALSDLFGRRKVYGFGSLAFGAIVFPSFWIMGTTPNPLMIGLAVVVPLGIVYSSILGPEPALFSELFRTRIRYTGISFVFQFSGIFASGLTPLIASTLLTAQGGQPWLLCSYIALVAVISAVAVLCMEEGSNRSIMGERKGEKTSVKATVHGLPSPTPFAEHR